MIDDPEEEAFQELEAQLNKKKVNQMTEQKIKKLAVQAGMYYRSPEDEFCEGNRDGVPMEMMRKFAELIRKDERESCAVTCEQIDNNGYPGSRHWPSDCAKAIRARGDKHD